MQTVPRLRIFLFTLLVPFALRTIFWAFRAHRRASWRLRNNLLYLWVHFGLWLGGFKLLGSHTLDLIIKLSIRTYMGGLLLLECQNGLVEQGWELPLVYKFTVRLDRQLHLRDSPRKLSKFWLIVKVGTNWLMWNGLRCLTVNLRNSLRLMGVERVARLSGMN